MIFLIDLILRMRYKQSYIILFNKIIVIYYFIIQFIYKFQKILIKIYLMAY